MKYSGHEKLQKSKIIKKKLWNLKFEFWINWKNQEWVLNFRGFEWVYSKDLESSVFKNRLLMIDGFQLWMVPTGLLKAYYIIFDIPLTDDLKALTCAFYIVYIFVGIIFIWKSLSWYILASAFEQCFLYLKWIQISWRHLCHGPSHVYKYHQKKHSRWHYCCVCV